MPNVTLVLKVKQMNKTTPFYLLPLTGREMFVPNTAYSKQEVKGL